MAKKSRLGRLLMLHGIDRHSMPNYFLFRGVGDNFAADQILSSIQQWDLTTEGIQRDSEHPTGQVTVSFINGEPEYEIVANSAWDFIESAHLPAISGNFILYHGSLALCNKISLNALRHLKSRDHG